MLSRENKSIAAIIPAYNEEKNIAPILEVLKNVNFLDHILIVDDGSKDKTARIAKEAGFEVLELKENQGKGAALQAGIEKLRDKNADIYMFIDADLVGLKAKHLEELIEPLFEDRSLSMTIGKFKGGRKRTDWAQYIIPTISGQRVLTKELVEALPDMSKSGFGTEVLITKTAKKNSFKTKEVILQNITQVMKEEKIGFRKGFTHRLKMYLDMLRSSFRKIK